MFTGLLGSTTLEVAIGLSFVYLLLALFCTTVNEWLAGLLKTRGKLLAQGVRQLLDGQPHGEASAYFLSAFYSHPLVTGMMTKDGQHPSYLPARTFAAVVLDLVKHAPGGDPSDAGRSVGSLADGDVKTALRALLPPDGGDFPKLQENVEGWFNDSMDRVSGWYKRRTQVWTIIVALIVTVAINADTLKIARHLWTDPALRQSVVEEAKARAAEPRPSVEVEYKNPNDPKQPTVTRSGDTIHEREKELLAQLVGWGAEEKNNGWIDWLLRVCGWLLSAIAVSLGAPFWFDVLNKFINIRSAGKSPDEAEKKPAKKKLAPADKAA
jgi:hypothetical protein